MSRVGKMPIAVPQGVDVAISAETITVKGKEGTLVRPLNPLVTIKNEGGKLMFAPANDSAAADAMSGTMRALVNNMVNGVGAGFSKKLTLVGVSGLLAASCSTTTVSNETSCLVWTPISWSSKDTPQTIEGVKLNNARRQAWCRAS